MLSKMASLQRAHSLRIANPLGAHTHLCHGLLQGCVLQGRTRLFVSIGSRFSWDFNHVFVHRQTRALFDFYRIFERVELTCVNNMHTCISDLVRQHYTLPHYDLSHGLIQHMRVTTTTLSSSTTFLSVSLGCRLWPKSISLPVDLKERKLWELHHTGTVCSLLREVRLEGKKPKATL